MLMLHGPSKVTQLRPAPYLAKESHQAFLPSIEGGDWELDEFVELSFSLPKAANALSSPSNSFIQENSGWLKSMLIVQAERARSFEKRKCVGKCMNIYCGSQKCQSGE